MYILIFIETEKKLLMCKKQIYKSIIRTYIVCIKLTEIKKLLTIFALAKSCYQLRR